MDDRERRLARRIAEKLYLGHDYPLTLEEIENSALIGIWKARATWEPRMRSLSRWQWCKGVSAALDAMRAESWFSRGRQERDCRIVFETEPSEVCWETPEALLLRKEKVCRIWRAVGRLSSTARNTLVDYYVHGRLYREIAEERGITESGASRSCADSRRRLRRWLH